MIKPRRLKSGDKVAVVSLSSGILGEEKFVHKFYIAKERLKKDFGLEVVVMPHAMKGVEFIAKHPQLRARDLMDAFEDDSISAIFCAIGGDDSIRLLPYVDFEIIRANPKIFMGYSDSTVGHFMMYKAGVTSFYGPSVICEFGEYVRMMDYTKKAVEDILFGKWDSYELLPSKEWSDDFISWEEANIDRACTLKADDKGYEVINGKTVAKGHLLGGCLDVFMMVIGTSIWPSLEEWENAILFVETSEEKPSPDFVKWTFRNLAAMGVLKVITGIMVGKPQGEQFYEEYKEAIIQVVVKEERLMDLPIFYNVNFGHAKPIGIIPYGIKAELDCERKSIRFLENPLL